MTIDTNILIAYLGGESKIIEQIQEWRRQDVILFVSSITECELLSYSKLSGAFEKKIERFLRENFIDVPFSRQIAQRAGVIRRKTTGLKLPDAAIAALAQEMKTPLVTRNVRDFKKISDLPIVTI